MQCRPLFGRGGNSILAVILLGALATAGGATAEPNAAVAAAIADPARPAADTARDANRKPLEVLTFAGLKPGDRVADYAGGSGYPFMGPVDMAAFNRAVFAALKPGGVYVVLDHVAAPGSPANVTDTLHRIEPGVVRREVEAAGFRFVGESKVLANPSDPHTVGPFNPSIQGRTDQFIYKFRKP